jgi:hypothetical protein
MATTTPNFGWPVPTSTDLVKDGATAIEALGDGIDTSLVDLKGGTTGQVLAKATSADMDFAWVAQDDSNAIQNAIVDAKGDLIAATANDTPARLAVGANGTYLVADSTASTGLKWETGTWTSWTPTFTSQGGTLTTVTINTAIYFQIGKLVTFTLDITITDAGTGTGFIRATLPSTPNASFTGAAQNINVTGFMGSSQIPSGDGGVYIAKYDNTTFISTAARIVASGNYRVA